MSRKEEILASWSLSGVEGYEVPVTMELDSIYQAMEEYAMQKCIEFIGFAVGEPYKYVSGDYDGIASLDMPPEEIYNQYIQSLTK